MKKKYLDKFQVFKEGNAYFLKNLFGCPKRSKLSSKLQAININSSVCFLSTTICCSAKADEIAFYHFDFMSFKDILALLKEDLLLG